MDYPFGSYGLIMVVKSSFGNSHRQPNECPVTNIYIRIKHSAPKGPHI